MRFRWKKLLSCRMLVAISCLTLVVLFIPHERASSIGSVKLPDGRQASIYSPFYKLSQALKLGKTMSSILRVNKRYNEMTSKWTNLSLEEKCLFYFEETFRINSDWNNDAIKQFYNDDKLDNVLGELMVERIRMYNTCFLEGQLPISKVFKSSSVIEEDIDSKVFPFLSKKKTLKEMWPEIINANEWAKLPDFSNPLLEGKDTWKLDPSYTFWYNWINFSSGRGIVMTLGVQHGELFKKLLLTLEKIDNTLPIQIVHTGIELTEAFMYDIVLFLKKEKLTQQVYFINASPLLDPEYAENYLNFFVNKWMALLFNTFEESILLDADVVSFVPTESYFDIPEYSKTGTLLFKDRNIRDENTFPYCIDLFKELFPSSEESFFMKHNLPMSANILRDDIDLKQLSIEEKAYYEFFQKRLLHHVDSGLVVTNRLKKLPSLLLSTMLNIDAKVQRCVYGDKELFWLGELLAGNNYSIYPTDGSILGPVHELENGIAEICATQMAHVSTEGKLMWSNGGLITCKITNAALTDFEHDQDYFMSKYGNPSSLQKMYDQPLYINGFITPDVEHFPWSKIKECHQYMYCARVQDEKGKLIRLDKENMQSIQEISDIWNSDVKLSTSVD